MAKVEAFPLKTARFTEIVEQCGKPSAHFALLDPAKDRPLQNLLRQNRVMSIYHGHRGEGADYGMVGLIESTGSQLLVFPKSIKRYAGRRIVGINYDLLEDSALVTKSAQPSAATRRQRKSTEEKPADASRGKRTPESAPTKSAPPLPAPPTMSELFRELNAVKRMLQHRQRVPALQRVGELATRIRGGLESPNGSTDAPS